MPPADDLSGQWQNPNDILSLLLLIGSDVVQKAIAQLFGVYVQPVEKFPRIYLTPAAFSFGWVAYAFTSLASVIGDKQLMPSTPDTPSFVINCHTGYVRTSQSWLLGRILRDHELAVEARPGPLAAKLKALNASSSKLEEAGLASHAPLHTALRIDIFNATGAGDASLKIDRVWLLGWLTIAMQLAISCLPWALYGDWAIFLTTAAGTFFALATGSLRQWALEKWPGRRLNEPSEEESALLGPPKLAGLDIESGNAPKAPPAPACECKFKPKTKSVCLTRGNGHPHVMVINGSGTAWDLETLATARSEALSETPWCLGVLAVAWTCLLISVSGLEANAWFLMAVGGLGMIQNVYAASARRPPESMGLALSTFEERPTIIGSSTCEPKHWYKGNRGNQVSDEALMTRILDPDKVAGVRGAIRELEKTIPRTGFALMPVYFPALYRTDRERYRDEAEARFWDLSFKRK
jgi:hypothetical protein